VSVVESINPGQRRKSYLRKTKQYRLTFEGTDLDGLVVSMRPVPIATVVRIAELEAIAQSSESSGLSAGGVEAMNEMFHILADALISWNLEDEVCAAHRDAVCQSCPEGAETVGVPVEATYEGLATLNLEDVMTLMRHWMQATSGVSPTGPLPPTSTGGDLSAVASLPMEALSASPAGSSEPS
jgi:hypothetical protein